MHVKTITKEKMYEVTSKDKTYTVIFQKKPGRTIIMCDCFSGTMFVNDGFCKHKEAAVIRRHLERLK